MRGFLGAMALIVGTAGFLAGGPVVRAPAEAPRGGQGTAASAARSAVSREAQREGVYALYLQARQDAKAFVDQGAYAEAHTQAQEALDLIDKNAALFSDIEAASLRDSAQAEFDLVEARRMRAQNDQATIESAPDSAAARATAAKLMRQKKVAALVSDAQKLYDATQFREAADLLRQATIIDPQDENVALFLRLTLDKIAARDAESRPRAGPGAQNVVPRPFEASPFEITVTTDRPTADHPTGDGVAKESAADRAARGRMEENLKEMSVEKQPLDKVLIFLRNYSAANILVNWAALHDAGVEKGTPVTVSMKEVPIRKALTTILAQVSAGTASISYIVNDGTIIISTKDDLTSPKYQTVQVYDIRDMLAAAPPEIPNATRPAAVAASGPATAPARQRQIEALIDTITTTVAPDTWVRNGGKIGTIRELNGQLIVQQTTDNQIAIYNLIQRLREMRNIQIAVESRIILVSNNFLDDFRIGWSVESSPITATAPGAPAAAKPPVFQATVIDNWTLSLLLTGTQADTRTIAVTVPRCTLFNGGKGRISCAAPQRYISGYPAKPVPIEAPPYAPEYGTIDTGLDLSIQATVSADRRSIVTQLNISRRILTRMDHAPAPNPPAEAKLQIDKPVVSAAAGNFVFSIPDGGTALIYAGRVPADFGRDGQAGAAKDERIMLILVRPNIIKYDPDLETKLFGAGNERPTGRPDTAGATGPATKP